jgi:hypothetical protein
VVVDMGFPAMLFGFVLVWRVHVLDRRVVVLVGVSGEQMSPVLTAVQVVRHVEVLVTMNHGLVLMVALRALLHRRDLLRRVAACGDPTLLRPSAGG